MLVLTYHAVEPGPAPLCVQPELFAEHAAVIADSGIPVLSVGEIAAALRAGELPKRAVAITFDDGFASVVEHAAPALREHGLRATVFCVAGHLGGKNDWATQAGWAPELRLATAGDLGSLAREGWELGSHGVGHTPLHAASDDAARREVVDSRSLLEDALGVRVAAFAWPYGAQPSPAVVGLIARTYDVACAAGPAAVRHSSDPHALPRVDIHYLRSTDRLRRALGREPTLELAVRRMAGRLRRSVRPDYSAPRNA
jgi:peptidoglycan/xylan/chitin deacetylase (PgdA/CDA1 family)